MKKQTHLHLGEPGGGLGGMFGRTIPLSAELFVEEQ